MGGTSCGGSTDIRLRGNLICSQYFTIISSLEGVKVYSQTGWGRWLDKPTRTANAPVHTCRPTWRGSKSSSQMLRTTECNCACHVTDFFLVSEYKTGSQSYYLSTEFLTDGVHWSRVYSFTAEFSRGAGWAEIYKHLNHTKSRQQKFRAMNGSHLANPIRGELGYAHWPQLGTKFIALLGTTFGAH